jgi:hypothetical protein
MIVTGCFWLAIGGIFLGLLFRRGKADSWRELLRASVATLECAASIATIIVAFAVLFRRNWARISAIVLALPWTIFGLWFIEPFLRIPASLFPRGLIAPYALAILAAVTWLALLSRKRVRFEFLPPPIVQIFVKLLGGGAEFSRPTIARALGNGTFELLPTGHYDPGGERWEFKPGSIVHGVEALRDGEPCLFAVSLYS